MKLLSRYSIFIFFLFFVFGGLSQIQQVKFYPALGTNGVTIVGFAVSIPNETSKTW